jgi:hypothetical protein
VSEHISNSSNETVLGQLVLRMLYVQYTVCQQTGFGNCYTPAIARTPTFSRTTPVPKIAPRKSLCVAASNMKLPLQSSAATASGSWLGSSLAACSSNQRALDKQARNTHHDVRCAVLRVTGSGAACSDSLTAYKKACRSELGMRATVAEALNLSGIM